ncbi:UNVERIFIED_CONTAM: hypothetical protein Sradi_3590200 [Sesamum radiatum]|uniref:Reverse transcriptase n=1 Tax=Sesamum radiatum TaxID=300843 RepID=A0AAW2QH65_SESRA
MLSNLISLAERDGELKGVAISRGGPRISHLLFADDTLIFCQATSEAMHCIKRILGTLEAASGLQVWRIISNPNSLLNRLLQHKYFPSSDILTVNPIQGSSFTWRSMLEARSVILCGSGWQVGDDKQIRIWSDQWIPSPIFFPVISIPIGLPIDVTVDALLTEEGEAWNEDLVRSIFQQEDSDLILNMPLDTGNSDTFR